MLFHAVLFNFKSDVSAASIDRIISEARTKLPSIPGVMNLFAGKALNENLEYGYAITMLFKDEGALEEYRDHPDHVQFRDVDFYPYVTTKTGIDYVD